LGPIWDHLKLLYIERLTASSFLFFLKQDSKLTAAAIMAKGWRQQCPPNVSRNRQTLWWKGGKAAVVGQLQRYLFQPCRIVKQLLGSLLLIDAASSTFPNIVGIIPDTFNPRTPLQMERQDTSGLASFWPIAHTLYLQQTLKAVQKKTDIYKIPQHALWILNWVQRW